MRPPPATPAIHVGGFRIGQHGRFWSVSDSQGQLVCLAVYKKGALEVVRRLLPPDLRHLADRVPGLPATRRQAASRYDPHRI